MMMFLFLYLLSLSLSPFDFQNLDSGQKFCNHTAMRWGGSARAQAALEWSARRFFRISFFSSGFGLSLSLFMAWDGKKNNIEYKKSGGEEKKNVYREKKLESKRKQARMRRHSSKVSEQSESQREKRKREKS